MIPECKKVIKYGNSLFGEKSLVSVKLMDKPNILFGEIASFNVCGFFLEMSISEQGQARWIDFSHVESIENAEKKVEENQVHPEFLQEAAEIVRNEFLQHGDWYNALVQSITGYLIETQGNARICDIAEGLAKRLIGDGEDGID